MTDRLHDVDKMDEKPHIEIVFRLSHLRIVTTAMNTSSEAGWISAVA